MAGLDRKSDPRKFEPSPTMGTDGIGSGGNNDKTASKDSLTGKNSVQEYKPGKPPMGGGSLGGKPC